MTADDPSSTPSPTNRSPSSGRGAGTTASQKWQPPAPETLSKLLPQYHIGELIGHGGMGAVYKGVQLVLERPVAIKLLPAEIADEEFIARFQSEARTLARLQHPGIVAVYDFGQTSEGHAYFVMELVDGVDLSQMMKSGALEPSVALDLTTQICEALYHAHSQGLIHRDIKPANILITKTGRAKLGDFGLAKPVMDDHGTLPASQVVRGTPDYMAPEQREGRADRRTDVYALGVMLYEMLTGKRPKGIFDPPSRKVQVDSRLDEVVTKALQQDPERRYQQVSDLKTDVDRIRTTQQTLQKDALPRFAKGKVRSLRGVVLPFASGVVATLVVASIILVWLKPQSATTLSMLPPKGKGLPGIKLKGDRSFSVVGRDGTPIDSAVMPADLRSKLEGYDAKLPNGSGIALGRIVLPEGESDVEYEAQLLRDGWSTFMGRPDLHALTGRGTISCPLGNSGPWTVEINKHRYKSIQFSIPNGDYADKIVWLGDIPLQAYSRTEPVWHTVKGTVADERGTPITSGEVIIRINGTMPKLTCALHDGSFAFRDITPAPYIMEVRIEGYSVPYRRIKVLGGDVSQAFTAYHLQKYLIRVLDPGDIRETWVSAGNPNTFGRVAFRDQTGITFGQEGNVNFLGCPADMVMRVGSDMFAFGPRRWTGHLKKGDIVELLDRTSTTVLHKIECLDVETNGPRS